MGTCRIMLTHRPHCSSVLGLPYKILNINHKRNYGGDRGSRSSSFFIRIAILKFKLLAPRMFGPCFLWLHLPTCRYLLERLLEELFGDT